MERHFNGNAENNNAVNEQIHQLLNENIYLRSEVIRLTSEIDHRLLEQDMELWNKLVDSFEETLKDERIQSMVLTNRELNMQRLLFEHKISGLKKDYEGQIEDLEDELNEFVKPRKRRPLD